MKLTIGYLALLAFASLALFRPLQAWAEGDRAHFTPNPDPTISGLTWDDSLESRVPRIQIDEASSGQNHYSVQIKGTYNKKGGNLFVGLQRVPIGPLGQFTLSIELYSDHQKFIIREIDASGEVRNDEESLQVPNWEAIRSSQEEYVQKKFSFQPSFGLSGTRYVQSGLYTIPANLTQFEVWLQLQAQYLLSPSFKLDGYVSGQIPIWNNTPIWFPDLNSGIYFFESSLRLSKDFGSPAKKNIFALSMGPIYLTTLTSNTIGYVNILGVALAPSLIHHLKHHRKLRVSFEFAPLLNNATFLNVSGNARYSFQAAYLFNNFKNKHPMEVSLKVSYLNLSLLPSGQAQSFTVALGTQLTF